MKTAVLSDRAVPLQAYAVFVWQLFRLENAGNQEVTLDQFARLHDPITNQISFYEEYRNEK